MMSHGRESNQSKASRGSHLNTTFINEKDIVIRKANVLNSIPLPQLKHQAGVVKSPVLSRISDYHYIDQQGNIVQSPKAVRRLSPRFPGSPKIFNTVTQQTFPENSGRKVS